MSTFVTRDLISWTETSPINMLLIWFIYHKQYPHPINRQLSRVFPPRRYSWYASGPASLELGSPDSDLLSQPLWCASGFTFTFTFNFKSIEMWTFLGSLMRSRLGFHFWLLTLSKFKSRENVNILKVSALWCAPGSPLISFTFTFLIFFSAIWKSETWKIWKFENC